ncbi:hypothetical protein [Lederbergia lenta]|uniref:Uncharacterized protein n=1 Tax=Lederbergia lenta TaxID=1467 RepID=A0A2X4VTI7_LEDLE|nr:hypothetical protein [Lederbergia lenta]MCM3110729.1 hypothetical protein [Lederbergia lenta]MEC2325875.1 hypothetical protein [Lederbergia lenta]SQI53619.1 Uncharacterised protein [Lederbergia lenta]
MLLLNGVTGLTDGSDGDYQQQDGKQFKKLCFSFVLPNGGKIINFTEPQIDTNFFKVEVEIFGRRRYILLNESYPFLAFASNVGYFSIDFVDESRLAELFSPFYCVVEAIELNEPLKIKLGPKNDILENDNELSRLELKEIAYWRPTKIGSVIFNHWD